METVFALSNSDWVEKLETDREKAFSSGYTYIESFDVNGNPIKVYTAVIDHSTYQHTGRYVEL